MPPVIMFSKYSFKVIIILLALYGAISVFIIVCPVSEQREAGVVNQLSMLSSALESYFLDNGAYPLALEMLSAELGKVYIERLPDCYAGGEWQYRLIGADAQEAVLSCNAGTFHYAQFFRSGMMMNNHNASFTE